MRGDWQQLITEDGIIRPPPDGACVEWLRFGSNQPPFVARWADLHPAFNVAGLQWRCHRGAVDEEAGNE